ncbi:MAG: hypothetical protein QOC80_2934, partial [Frankiaceae bacterium]|nr:hypothetical protein [Frankiaceae bacterium]
MATLLTVNDSTPEIADSAFVASTAVVAGKVTLGDKASVWYGCVLRAEIEPITIGASSNVQDL